MTFYSDTGVYYRVSTNQQEEDMQIGAALAYMKAHHIQNVQEFNDHGVGAISNPMEERPELMKLLEAIKSGQIKKLIVYARDRLARDPYEYSPIVDIFYEYNVEVIFTAHNSVPFQRQKHIEIIFAIQAYQEGQNIKNRTTDRFKRFPSRILGYHTNRDEFNKLYYTADLTKKNLIEDFFDHCSQANSQEEFFIILDNYQKIFKKKILDLVKMIENPFYAGHCHDSSSKLVILEYVEPIISLDTYHKSNENLRKYTAELYKILKQVNPITPVCSICNRTMKLKNNTLTYNGYFYCSNKHEKVQIEVDELNQKTKDIISHFSKSISIKNLKKLVLHYVNELILKYTRKISTFDLELTRIKLNTSLNYNPNKFQQAIHGNFQLMESIKSSRKSTLADRYNLELTKNEIGEVIKIIAHGVHFTIDNERLAKLAPLIINRVEISPWTVQFHLFFKNFLDPSFHNTYLKGDD